MSTIGVVRDLGEFFHWVGIAGAVIAVLCAIVVAVALAMGAAGIAGGSGAVWIGGALLSLGSGFSGQWIPAISAAGALAAALVLGAVLRPAVRRFRERPKPEPVESPVAASATPASPAPASRMVGVRTIASESIR